MSPTVHCSIALLEPHMGLYSVGIAMLLRMDLVLADLVSGSISRSMPEDDIIYFERAALQFSCR